jgi:hypothetical protein
MSISKKIVGWCLCLILATAGSIQAQEKNSQDMEKSCRRAMQGFYNGVVGKGRKYPSAVLSRELDRQIQDDDDHGQDENGLITGLDWSPIAGGNDICTRYEAGKVTRKGDRFLVEISCFWGKEKANKLMKHEVMHSRGRWVIMNIHYYQYEKGKLTDYFDLLSTLKKSREDRRKNAK